MTAHHTISIWTHYITQNVNRDRTHITKWQQKLTSHHKMTTGPDCASQNINGDWHHKMSTGTDAASRNDSRNWLHITKWQQDLTEHHKISIEMVCRSQNVNRDWRSITKRQQELTTYHTLWIETYCRIQNVKRDWLHKSIWTNCTSQKWQRANRNCLHNTKSQLTVLHTNVIRNGLNITKY